MENDKTLDTMTDEAYDALTDFSIEMSTNLSEIIKEYNIPKEHAAQMLLNSGVRLLFQEVGAYQTLVMLAANMYNAGQWGDAYGADRTIPTDEELN